MQPTPARELDRVLLQERMEHVYSEEEEWRREDGEMVRRAKFWNNFVKFRASWILRSQTLFSSLVKIGPINRISRKLGEISHVQCSGPCIRTIWNWKFVVFVIYCTAKWSLFYLNFWNSLVNRKKSILSNCSEYFFGGILGHKRRYK